MHRMCDFFVPRDRCKPHTRGTRIASPAGQHVEQIMRAFGLRTWYTDCITFVHCQNMETSS